MKRKLTTLLLALTISVTVLFTGCTTGGGQETSRSEVVQSTEENTTTSEEASTEEATTQESTSETKTEEPKEPFVADRSAAFALLSNIKIGWNLGNTLDAHGAGMSVVSETYWGNPKTTQEMIDTLAAKGFNAIRIPVTFAEHVGKAPDY